MSRSPVLDSLEARDPEAVVLRGAESAWTVPAMREAIQALHKMLDRGGRPAVVAVLADNGPAWAMADLAVLDAGIAHLPVPGFFSPAQMAHALDRTGAAVLLTDQPERIASLGLGFAQADTWCGLAVMRRPCARVALPAGTAKISFTSGSTGQPKGVCLSARGLLQTAQAITARLSGVPVERHLAVLPLALLLENVAGIYAPLLQGATLHLPGLASLGWQGMAGFDPARLQQRVQDSQANSAILVPELLKAWTFHLGRRGENAPASLRYVAVGGACVSRELLHAAKALGLPVYQGYGLTECGSVVCLNRPDDECDGVGRPLDHVEVRIDDSGEIRIAAHAFLGYLGEAPHSPDADFPTGDLGHWTPTGHLQLHGRRKNLLINSFGRNVAPEWIEAALLAEPAIAQAVVVGDGEAWLAALLAPAAGADPGAVADAVARVNSGLPDYARLGGWLPVPPFTPDNGLATGNGRPVRTRIHQEHAAALAALYSEKESTHVVL
ncbi:MAG: AMP-binding protein [Pseudomonadota bacterium]